MISINFNPAVLGTQYNLGICSMSLSKALQRMSTGYKINCTKDDVAGSYIANKMATKLRGYEIAQRNTQTALTLINTAESALNNISKTLGRIRELAIQGSNEIYSLEQRVAFQNEANSQLNHIFETRILTEYNGLKLLQDEPFGGGCKSYSHESSADTDELCPSTHANGSLSHALRSCLSFIAYPRYRTGRVYRYLYSKRLEKYSVE